MNSTVQALSTELPIPSTTTQQGRELLGMGALVLVLGTLFVTLLVGG